MPTSELVFPQGATVEQLRDYCERHVRDGRGAQPLALDPRGLSYLTRSPEVRLALPLDGEGSHDGRRVFLRAVF